MSRLRALVALVLSLSLVAAQQSVTLVEGDASTCLTQENNAFQGSISMPTSVIIDGAKCGWYINTPSLPATEVYHQLHLNIRSLSLRPHYDSLTIYANFSGSVEATQGSLKPLASLVQIDASMSPFTIIANASSTLFVYLVTDTVRDNNRMWFAADYEYKCIGTSAQCQLDKTNVDDGSSGAKAGFLLIVFILMILLVGFGFAKSYRSPFQ